MMIIRKVRNKLKAIVRARKYKYLENNLHDLVQVLRMHYNQKTTNLTTLKQSIIPEKIEGFHDLSYLFACHQANRGIIAQDFDEAAYLWKIITQIQPLNILEIGRWLGGSTILQCAAASQYKNGFVTSIDIKVKAPDFAKDDLIENHLKKLNLNNYQLIVSSSFDYVFPKQIDLAFIDGDHSYEGVKKDFENTIKYLADDGHILFHDSCNSRPFATNHEPVAKLMSEIKQMQEFTLVNEIGSITHFCRK
jgi:predicted O-methyltransferase YrrM